MILIGCGFCFQIVDDGFDALQSVMQTVGFAYDERFVASLAWLFPLTYLVHIAEEYWGGEGFPAWYSRIVSSGFITEHFLILNMVGWLLMVAGIVLASRMKFLRWLLIGLAIVVLTNGLAHLVASLVTASYSPGVVSGLLLWVPLGTVTLLRVRKTKGRFTNPKVTPARSTGGK